jgi:hypothetical protein
MMSYEYDYMSSLYDIAMEAASNKKNPETLLMQNIALSLDELTKNLSDIGRLLNKHKSPGYDVAKVATLTLNKVLPYKQDIDHIRQANPGIKPADLVNKSTVKKSRKLLTKIRKLLGKLKIDYETRKAQNTDTEENFYTIDTALKTYEKCVAVLEDMFVRDLGSDDDTNMVAESAYYMSWDF